MPLEAALSITTRGFRGPLEVVEPSGPLKLWRLGAPGTRGVWEPLEDARPRNRFRRKGEHLETISGLLPGSQGPNLALTVLCVHQGKSYETMFRSSSAPSLHEGNGACSPCSADVKCSLEKFTR